MARELFRAPLGIEIESEDLTSSVNILRGTGAPGSLTIEQNAPVGSIYLQSDAASNDLNVWWKFRVLNNDATDWHAGASKEYVDNLILGGVSTGTATAATTTIVDTLPVVLATEVKWLLQIKDLSGNRRAAEIHALTDGTTVSYTTYGALKLGNISNIGFDVTLSGGSPNVWQLSLAPSVGTGDLTYTSKRVDYSYLA